MRWVPEFHSGTRTPREFLEECLVAVSAHEPRVKAFVSLDADAVRHQADASTRRYRSGRPRSPVDGCPIAIKDIMATADMPTQMNSPIFRGWQPRHDSACVAALRRAGAIIFGKTVTTEFAIDRSGPTTNPHDPRRTPGGSSSGSAAAVASGMVPVALGTQTLGSILRPASYCGVVGFKPTHGALHTGGIHPLSYTLDHLGTLASTLDDAWLVAEFLATALAGPGHARAFAGPSRKRSTPLRLICLQTRGWREADRQSQRTFVRVMARLRDAGAEVIPPMRSGAIAGVSRQLDAHVDDAVKILAYEMQYPFGEYLLKHGARSLGSRIRHLLADAAAISLAEYSVLLARRSTIRAAVDGLLGPTGVFVTLASSGPAPSGLAFTGSRTFPSYASWLGLPAISLPVMTVRGLPLGLQLVGRTGSDRALRETARQVWTLLQGSMR